MTLLKLVSSPYSFPGKLSWIIRFADVETTTDRSNSGMSAALYQIGCRITGESHMGSPPNLFKRNGLRLSEAFSSNHLMTFCCRKNATSIHLTAFDYSERYYNSRGSLGLREGGY
uniref:Uncharacterized protein n=1 Tax=Ascaris lumbricoides TaxID=6252 RepID=A0A0M3IE46_ASCLU